MFCKAAERDESFENEGKLECRCGLMTRIGKFWSSYSATPANRWMKSRQHVGSSKTPVWNRIRKLKGAGVIGQQTVLLDAEALGFEATFFVLIRTSEHEAEWQRKFLKALRGPARSAGGAPPGRGYRLYPEGARQECAGL